MDKRVIKYVFKDIKFNLLVYFLSLILFLMIMYSLKYFNLIERISGVEIIGALVILIPNSVKILFDFLFLKGNNFKRRTIGIVYLFYGITLSSMNSLIVNLIDYILNGTMIIENYIDLNTIYFKFIFVFGITFIGLLCIWIFALLIYRVGENKFFSLISIISMFILFKIIKDSILNIPLSLNFIISSICLLSGILIFVFYWRVKRFEVIGGTFE